MKPDRVSAHGGHSGQFCSHAADSLEEIVTAYIESGYQWVGITEHMPPAEDRFVYHDEHQAGLDAAALLARFADYISTARRLQERYRSDIDLFVGFETETYAGSMDFVRMLQDRFAPDYIVGSIHHVNDREIDYGPESYHAVARDLGGLDALYCRYFDEQFAMLDTLRPRVVGHLDRVRLFDSDYEKRLRRPDVWQRIERNLDLIQRYGGMLDCNLGGFDRPAGADEPSPTRPILAAALTRGIPLVPGDDSHGVASVGRNFERGVAVLRELGADLDWTRPATGRNRLKT